MADPLLRFLSPEKSTFPTKKINFSSKIWIFAKKSMFCFKKVVFRKRTFFEINTGLDAPKRALSESL